MWREALLEMLGEIKPGMQMEGFCLSVEDGGFLK
jgi:hypothetical protein